MSGELLAIRENTSVDNVNRNTQSPQQNWHTTSNAAEISLLLRTRLSGESPVVLFVCERQTAEKVRKVILRSSLLKTLLLVAKPQRTTPLTLEFSGVFQHTSACFFFFTAAELPVWIRLFAVISLLSATAGSCLLWTLKSDCLLLAPHQTAEGHRHRVAVAVNWWSLILFLWRWWRLKRAEGRLNIGFMCLKCKETQIQLNAYVTTCLLDMWK